MFLFLGLHPDFVAPSPQNNLYHSKLYSIVLTIPGTIFATVPMNKYQLSVCLSIIVGLSMGPKHGRPIKAQMTEQSTCNPSMYNLSMHDLSMCDISTRDLGTCRLSTCDSSMCDLSTRNLSTCKLSTNNISTYDLSTHNLSTCNHICKIDLNW